LRSKRGAQFFPLAIMRSIIRRNRRQIQTSATLTPHNPALCIIDIAGENPEVTSVF
ncbi:hypothetical protein PMI09_02146, partial [Rhizobium sp. CF122]